LALAALKLNACTTKPDTCVTLLLSVPLLAIGELTESLTVVPLSASKDHFATNVGVGVALGIRVALGTVVGVKLGVGESVRVGVSVMVGVRVIVAVRVGPVVAVKPGVAVACGVCMAYSELPGIRNEASPVAGALVSLAFQDTARLSLPLFCFMRASM